MSCIKWRFCVWRCQRGRLKISFWAGLCIDDGSSNERRIHHKYDIILQVEQSSRQQSSAVSAPFLSEHSLAVNEFMLLSGPAKSLMRAFLTRWMCKFICLDFKLHMMKNTEHVWHFKLKQKLFEASLPVCCLSRGHLWKVLPVCKKKKKKSSWHLKTLQEIMCGADAVGCDDELIYF